MRHLPFFAFFCLLIYACQNDKGQALNPNTTRFTQLPAEGLLPRNVDVWVPQAYLDAPELRLPVLYMQDGQNLIFPEASTTGATWKIPQEIENQIQKGAIPPCMVVAIWSTVERLAEYLPEQIYLQFPASAQEMMESQNLRPKSDRYLDWLVNDLKPIIDENFRTLPERTSTFAVGSGMGGILSLYALVRYPQIFGGAAALSPHWPILTDTLIPALPEATIQFLAENMPALDNTRLYLDHGDEGIDADYQPWQRAFSRALGMRGFINGKDFISLKFPGDDHSASSWSRRFYQPLVYLFPPEGPSEKAPSQGPTIPER